MNRCAIVDCEVGSQGQHLRRMLGLAVKNLFAPSYAMNDPIPLMGDNIARREPSANEQLPESAS